MEIEWGEFYFQCGKTVAILLAVAPLVLMMQLPPVIRGINRILERMRRSKAGQSITARIKVAERNK